MARITAPTAPRWKKTFTRNRPLPGSGCETSSSRLLFELLALAAGEDGVDQARAAVRAGAARSPSTGRSSPFSRICGGEPAVRCRSEPPALEQMLEQFVDVVPGLVAVTVRSRFGAGRDHGVRCRLAPVDAGRSSRRSGPASAEDQTTLLRVTRLQAPLPALDRTGRPWRRRAGPPRCGSAAPTSATAVARRHPAHGSPERAGTGGRLEELDARRRRRSPRRASPRRTRPWADQVDRDRTPRRPRRRAAASARSSTVIRFVSTRCWADLVCRPDDAPITPPPGEPLRASSCRA